MQMSEGRRASAHDTQAFTNSTSGTDPSGNIKVAMSEFPDDLDDLVADVVAITNQVVVAPAEGDLDHLVADVVAITNQVVAPAEDDLDHLVADIVAITNQVVAPAEGDQAFSGREDLERRLKILDDSKIIRLTGMKVPHIHGGKLTVFGHLCVSKSCPKELLDPLLSRVDVNLSEEFDGHRIPLLHLAAYCGNETAVELLCQRDELDLHARDSTNLTALHMSVKSRNVTICRCIYKTVGGRVYKSNGNLSELACPILLPLISGKDDLGMTPLHHAAWEGCNLIIYNLFAYEEWVVEKTPEHTFVDVNATDNGGFTPLHLASWHNHLEAVNFLLKHRKIDTTRQSGPLMHIAKMDLQKDIQSQINRMESHLWQFCAARKDSLHPCSSEKVEEKKGWEDANRKRAAQLLFPNADFSDNEKLTALHCAACQGNLKIVAALMKKISSQERATTTLNAVDKYGFTALHHAVMGGDASMIEELLSSQMVRGNLREVQGSLTPLNMAYILLKGDHLKGVASLKEHQDDIAREYIGMITLLSEHPDVKAYTESLYKDRQLYVDAANAILVGAALIASITFAGWLQPPLGYQQYFETSFLLTGSAPPDTYASYAAVGQHVSVQIFWISNSLSFFFAITTVLIGACVVLPVVGRSQLELDVQRMRKLHIWTTLALSFSVFFVLGAFIAAGFASLPPRLEYQWGMIMTTIVGGFVGLGALAYYLHRVITIIQWIAAAPTDNFGAKMKTKVG